MLKLPLVLGKNDIFCVCLQPEHKDDKKDTTIQNTNNTGGSTFPVTSSKSPQSGYETTNFLRKMLQKKNQQRKQFQKS